MRADSFVALNIALTFAALAFVASAAFVLRAPVLHAQAAILLPLMVMAGLVVIPFAVWALTRGYRHHRVPAL